MASWRVGQELKCNEMEEGQDGAYHGHYIAHAGRAVPITLDPVRIDTFGVFTNREL